MSEKASQSWTEVKRILFRELTFVNIFSLKKSFESSKTLGQIGLGHYETIFIHLNKVSVNLFKGKSINGNESIIQSS